MHGVGQQLRPILQHGFEVDQPGPLCRGHPFDRLLDPVVPLAGTGLEPTVPMRDRGHPANVDLRRRIGRSKTRDQGGVIRDELVPVIGPVPRVGVVDPEVDHHDVGPKSDRRGILVGFRIGIMAPVQERRAAAAEVPYVIPRAEHPSQHGRIAVSFAIVDQHAVRDAVPDARHPHRCRGIGGGSPGALCGRAYRRKAEENQANFFHRIDL